MTRVRRAYGRRKRVIRSSAPGNRIGAQVGPADACDQRVRSWPSDARIRNLSRVLDRLLIGVRRAAIPRGGKNSDVVGLRINEGMAQVGEGRQPIMKRTFPGAEALSDYIGKVVIYDVLLGIHELLEALHPQGFSGGTGHQQNVGQRRGSVRPLDIKRDFQGPEVVIFLAGAIVRWRWCSGWGPLDFENIKVWCFGIARYRRNLPTHMREIEGRVKDAQVVADGIATEVSYIIESAVSNIKWV